MSAGNICSHALGRRKTSYRVTFPINGRSISKLSSFVEKYEQLGIMGKWETFFHGYLAGCNATLFENKTIKHGA